MEGSVVGYMFEQHVMRFLQLDSAISSEDRKKISHSELRQSSQWLVNRIGRANARRKQQFVYWREHSQRLGRNVPSKVSQYQAPDTKLTDPNVLLPPPITEPASSEYTTDQSYVISDPTTATQMNRDAVILDDNASVASSISRVSTKIGWGGEQINWPNPPDIGEDMKFFVCPYCKVICPSKYLAVKAWRYDWIQNRLEQADY